MSDLMEMSSYIIPLIIAITLHEAAHGYVASKLGDDTAKRMGRVSFDPIKHIDPFGTLVLPALMMLAHSPIMIGWAKPVPVNFNRLNHPRRDAFLVAIAGPAINILLALLSAFALHLSNFISPEDAPWTFMNLIKSMNVNLVLALFNLLPILPLDGGRIINALLPRDLARIHARSEPHGMMIILLMFMLPGLLSNMGINIINPSYYLINLPFDTLRDSILSLAGIGNSP